MAVALLFQDVVREGVGRRLSPPGRDLDAVLGRDPPARRAAVARQRPHPDGLAQQPHHFGLVNHEDELNKKNKMALLFHKRIGR